MYSYGTQFLTSGGWATDPKGRIATYTDKGTVWEQSSFEKSKQDHWCFEFRSNANLSFSVDGTHKIPIFNQDTGVLNDIIETPDLIEKIDQQGSYYGCVQTLVPPLVKDPFDLEDECDSPKNILKVFEYGNRIDDNGDVVFSATINKSKKSLVPIVESLNFRQIESKHTSLIGKGFRLAHWYRSVLNHPYETARRFREKNERDKLNLILHKNIACPNVTNLIQLSLAMTGIPTSVTTASDGKRKKLQGYKRNGLTAFRYRIIMLQHAAKVVSVNTKNPPVTRWSGRIAVL